MKRSQRCCPQLPSLCGAVNVLTHSLRRVLQVPLVTGPAYHQGRLGNATLARGVFMVQDVFDPELQPASYSLRDSVTGGVKVVTSSFRDSMPAHSEPGEGYTER